MKLELRLRLSLVFLDLISAFFYYPYLVLSVLIYVVWLARQQQPLLKPERKYYNE